MAAFIIVLGMLISSEIGRLTRGFNDISPNDVTLLMNHNTAVLVDIRTAAENREGHILNSKHIPTGELTTRVSELEKHKQDHVIAYCRSGSRSIAACKILKTQGFENVHNLGGGIMAWESANLPTTKN
ncbi:MAG: rhodanese-like domain-containing protein [Gammaproteobacteria bacterium]|nr:MAG: rhodanese-like domain-containing protein [Gammaproteobacteria bacterium]